MLEETLDYLAVKASFALANNNHEFEGEPLWAAEYVYWYNVREGGAAEDKEELSIILKEIVSRMDLTLAILDELDDTDSDEAFENNGTNKQPRKPRQDYIPRKRDFISRAKRYHPKPNNQITIWLLPLEAAGNTCYGPSLNNKQWCEKIAETFGFPTEIKTKQAVFYNGRKNRQMEVISLWRKNSAV